MQYFNLVLHHYYLDMSRTRINVVESNEEYMMEEPIEHHNSAEKDVESSDVHGRATNDEEGFTDCDDADENEDSENEKQKSVRRGS